MEQAQKIVDSINEVMWGPPMLILLVGTGVYLTFLLRGVQVRKLGSAFKKTFGGLFSKKDEEGVSSFASLATAIAAQVGTGNLAGVATAIAAGGPGAIFWMWISGFFGMATIFAEAVVAQRFTVKNEDGQKIGGPVYYISQGIKNKTFARILAAFFAITIILALGLMGNGVQSNSIAAAVNNAFDVPVWITGTAVAALVLVIVVGGVKRITTIAEFVVPFMALFYIIGCLIIVLMHASEIFPAFKSIFVGAFTPTAAMGGFAGAVVKTAVQKGVARGLFSNEAGMGSTPHAHALANVDHPVEQGLVATLGVVIDTGIVCTMTSLVILTTGVLTTGATGAELTQAAFVEGFGNFGSQFIAICLFFFAFTTIIGWYFFGETNVRYLFNKGVYGHIEY